jgi:hypothetical protein
MSTEYAILIHAEEKPFENPTPELREAMYARHGEFARRCEAEGHEITGGGELRPTATARVVRPGPTADAALVTDGPFAELVEQVGGYYVVRTDDLDGLVRVLAASFAGSTEVFEVRPVVAEDVDDKAGTSPAQATAGAAS